MSHNLGEMTVVWQMANPTRHQIEHAPIFWEQAPVARGQRGDGTLVYMGDEPGRRVERKIVTRVLLGDAPGGRSGS